MNKDRTNHFMQQLIRIVRSSLTFETQDDYLTIPEIIQYFRKVRLGRLGWAIFAFSMYLSMCSSFVSMLVKIASIYLCNPYLDLTKSRHRIVPKFHLRLG